jgi:hypothetical protein
MKATAFVVAILLSGPAQAHDHWINFGGYKAPTGEHCCGDNDCEALPDSAGVVKISKAGYAISYRSRFLEWHSGAVGVPVEVSETVPFSEAQTSEDSHYWRCQRSDNTRRCFFAPQPGS